MSRLEIILTLTAFLLLLIYHVHLIHQLRTAPMTTSIGLTNHLRLEWVQSTYLTKVLNRGTTHYTLGMRAYYLADPFVLWLFGPTWMLGGAILITAILYKETILGDELKQLIEKRSAPA